MIGVINFGLGNLGSIVNAFERIDCRIEIFQNPTKILNYDHLILPGVGSFRVGMNNLIKQNWNKAIYDYVDRGRPLLGICLGMQLIFELGEEDGINKGLGLIKGKVSKIKIKNNEKLPHVGWNTLSFVKKHFVLRNLKEHVDYYFVHSYECIPDNKENLIAYSNYGGKLAACISNSKNVFGTQFHPEKSPPNGFIILKNFSEWDGKC